MHTNLDCFLSKSIRALHVPTPHRRQPTGDDSLAVQISIDDEQEIAEDEGAVLAATQPLFAPLHRRTLTPLGGRNTRNRNAAGDTEKDGDTCSSGYLPSSMNVLPSNATMTSASSSESLDQSKALQLSAGSTCSGKSKSISSSKKQNKKKVALLSLQPLPRLGTDASKHSTRNFSTEVLADESTTPSTEKNTKVERNAYYDSLTLSKNDVAYCASTSSSFFGGVLARDGRNNALEFRLPADGMEGGERSEEDTNSISNLTHRSGRTTGSVETIQHSNKAKRGAKNLVGLRKIADSVRPIDEGGGECTDSVDESDNEFGGSPSRSPIPKVLRKTGTKIKRALREVAGTKTKSKLGPTKDISERFITV